MQRRHFILAHRQRLQLLQFAERLVLDARDSVIPQISVKLKNVALMYQCNGLRKSKRNWPYASLLTCAPNLIYFVLSVLEAYKVKNKQT